MTKEAKETWAQWQAGEAVQLDELSRGDLIDLLIAEHRRNQILGLRIWRVFRTVRQRVGECRRAKRIIETKVRS